MPLTALTHDISPDIAQGERTWIDRDSIDLARADQQHLSYRNTLSDLGVEVVNLNVNRAFPDSVFMEDPAVVVDEVAILARMGAPPRRAETEALGPVLGQYRTVLEMQAPATLDGGDVLLMGRRIFVGQSTRTNQNGYQALADMLAPYGYEVIPVDVYKGCLHLITGTSALDGETLLFAPGKFDTVPLKDYKLVEVPKEEAWAANVLAVNGTILVPGGYPRTAELVSGLGYPVQVLDNSELEKAEGSLTCLSLIFST